MQPAIARHRPWTVLVYMAGDNGKAFQTPAGAKKLMAEMTSAGYKDIWEMAKVGTTDACAVVCLFDTLEGSYLVEVREGAGMASSVVQKLGEVNTGHPDSLRDFLVHGVQNYPADHIALVIWNHGTGWLDADHYASVRAADPGHDAHGAIFRTTPRRMAGARAAGGTATTRPIAFDDSSKDFLDSKDLRQAFSEAQAITGRRLDIIGMDACLMAMAEGACELRPYADYFVASQEVEPMDGWPYAPIVTGLNAERGLAPEALADRIVREYAGIYNAQTRHVETITQSAIRLAATQDTETLVTALANAILAHPGDEELRSAVRHARGAALKFQDTNYSDLGDFARWLAGDLNLRLYAGLQDAAAALYQHLEARDPGKPIVQVAFRPRYSRATGLSVYLPGTLQPAAQRRKALDIYRGLLFAQTTGWDRLLAWLDPESEWH